MHTISPITVPSARQKRRFGWWRRRLAESGPARRSLLAEVPGRRGLAWRRRSPESGHSLSAGSSEGVEAGGSGGEEFEPLEGSA